MSTFELDGWCKKSPTEKSVPIGTLHFYISDADHLSLEQAEERLQETGEQEAWVDVNPRTFNLQAPPACGPLADYRLRVYLRPEDQRGQFHLVGHRFSDGALVYSNAMMIDMLME